MLELGARVCVCVHACAVHVNKVTKKYSLFVWLGGALTTLGADLVFVLDMGKY